MKVRLMVCILLAALVLGLTQPAAVASAGAVAPEAWDGKTAEAFSGGDGSEENPYKIANGAQLYYLSMKVQNSDAADYEDYVSSCYEITENINLGDKLFPMLNTFEGTLDGKGYQIFGLNLYSESTSQYTGLIRSGTGCTLKNLILGGTVNSVNYGYTAAFVGKLSGGVVENCVNRCSVTSGNSYIGGIVGYMGSSSQIISCINEGAVSGKSYTGGICGYLSGPAKYEEVNVFVAVSGCYNIADVSGSSTVGGIIGYQSGGTIRECANFGDVAATGSTAGGIVGAGISKNCTSVSYVNKVPKYSYPKASSFISDCYNTGSVSASNYAGGLAGSYTKCTRVTDGYHQSHNSLGGIYYSYNAGKVSISTEDGNCGDILASVSVSGSAVLGCTSVYYHSELNPDATVTASNTVGNSEEVMQQAGGFNGFDFADIWSWDTSNEYKYPMLEKVCVHEYTELSSTATCVSSGAITCVCEICGEINLVYDEIGEHSFTHYISNNDATCIKDETRTAKCDYCDATDTVTIENSRGGHSLGEWQTVTEATYVADGSQVRTCQNCTYSEERVVPATGPALVEQVIAAYDSGIVMLINVPQDMTVVLAGYKDGKMAYVEMRTGLSSSVVSVVLPADIEMDNLRVFFLAGDWQPVGNYKDIDV